MRTGDRRYKIRKVVPRLVLHCSKDGESLHINHRRRLIPAGIAEGFRSPNLIENYTCSSNNDVLVGQHQLYVLKTTTNGQQQPMLIATESLMPSLDTLLSVVEEEEDDGSSSGENKLELARRLKTYFIRALRQLVERDQRLRKWVRVIEYDNDDVNKAFDLITTLQLAVTEQPAMWQIQFLRPSYNIICSYLALAFFCDCLKRLIQWKPTQDWTIELLCPMYLEWTLECYFKERRLVSFLAFDRPLDKMIPAMKSMKKLQSVPMRERRQSMRMLKRRQEEGKLTNSLSQLITPLRTISLAIINNYDRIVFMYEKEPVYKLRATMFIEKLQALLQKHPDVGVHYTMLKYAHPFDMIEKFSFEKSAANVCSVCLDNMEKVQDLVELSVCRHQFHKHCYMQICDNGHVKCPYCRAMMTNITVYA